MVDYSTSRNIECRGLTMFEGVRLGRRVRGVRNASFGKAEETNTLGG